MLVVYSEKRAMSIPAQKQFSSVTIQEDFLQQVSQLREPVTLILNDTTRPTQAKYLSFLQQALPASTRIIFATGTHRAVTIAGSKYILGSNFSRKFLMVSNDCDDGSHVYVGKTSRGTEVEFHPWVLEGSVVAVNTVEPHYFAGFTGGRKSIFPGVSSRKTIEQNHFLACFPEASVGKLIGNPVHEDMMEGLKFLTNRTKVLMINGVSGSDKMFCGGCIETFIKAVELSRSFSEKPVKRLYSSVEVRPGGSLEVNLYQAMKAVHLWEKVVKDGGELVLKASCPEGLGAKQMQRLLADSMETFNIPASSVEYNLGDHASIRIGRIRKRIRLSFNVGIDLRKYGFNSSPRTCEVVVNNAGFCFPIMDLKNA